MTPEVAKLYMDTFEDTFIYSANPFHSYIIKWWQ